MSVRLLGSVAFAGALSMLLWAPSPSTITPASVATTDRGGTSELRSIARNSPDRIVLTGRTSDAGSSARLFPPHTKSILKHGGQLGYDGYLWNDIEDTDGQPLIWVDLRRQTISVYRNGHEIGASLISYGADGFATPTGRFAIQRKVRDYHSRTYDAPMPNSLFITADGIALHGAPMGPGSATHGCIGLPVQFARKLFEIARPGDLVEIIRSDKARVDRLSRAQGL